MECTQRLECTQQYDTHRSHSQNERLFPEQIGFLGICGSKYPVKKGPNKIGRDPQTCNIVLKLHSVSRQHAVINILNNKDFMLMDLDSANKTKLSGVTLQPYIPHPLHNGDTVQFGEIFGIFRLLEEETDLPMTQAIDIPETPVSTKHISRINAVTTIPESPDVSDRDDSFIAPSQPKGHQFQGSKTRNFIKPGKTISIQPMGTNKIDNVYWNSSKKSTSLNLDDSTSSLDDLMLSDKLNEKENDVVNDIHELETQEVFATPKPQNVCTNLIHTADTQLPDLDNAGPSIHTANTQMPGATSSPCMHSLDTQVPCELISPSIHNLNTQMPGAISSPDVPLSPGENLPEVCKINEQQDMQIDLCANKENDVGIYNAETQLCTVKKENVLTDFNNMNESLTRVKTNSKLNVSNDEILFDEIDNQPCGDFESQPFLCEDIDLPINRLVEPEPELESQSQIVMPKCAKRSMRIKSDSSTDCEDRETLKVNKNKDDDDDNTDCEEELCKLQINENETCKASSSKSAEFFEEMATQVIMLNDEPSKANTDVNFEDMPTQVLDIGDIEKNAKIDDDKSNMGFEDLATQVIDIPLKNKNGSNQLSLDEDSPFKVPFNSSMKGKKYVSKTPKIKLTTFKSNTNLINVEHNRYYQDTQDIYEDLCTQRIDLPDVVPEKNTTSLSDAKSVDKFDGQNSYNSKSKNLMLDTSFNNMDPEENVNDFVSNLSSQEVRDVIGIDTQVASVKKVPSDSSTTSDVEITPKKQRLLKFSDIDLPNSQEIKSIVSLATRDDVTESSSESDTEVNSEEQCTPILFRKKRKPKIDTRLDLTKKFDIEALPSRIITRVRKPTAKFQDLELKKSAENILKPKFVTEQEGEISKEIITENITRLKSKSEKIKNSMSNIDSDKDNKQVDSKKETKQTGSKKERKQFDSSKDTKQDVLNNDIKHINYNKETKQTGLSKENKFVRSSKETEQATSNNEIKQTDLKKDNKQVASKIENKQANTIKETKHVNSHERIELAASREVTKQAVSNKTIEQAGSSKETRPVCSSKEAKQIDMEIETKDRKVIREHSSRRTGEKEKVEKKPTERTKMSSNVNKRRKREPKNGKMESEKPQSDTTVNNTVQSLNSTVESKYKTNSCSKSKEYYTSDLTSSPVETKRSTRSARIAKTKKTETKSASPERDSQNSRTEKPNKRKYTRKKELTKEEKEPSHENEVRRSKRQRTMNTKEEPMKVTKSILKKSITVPHEESAVYNISSGSNSDTSRSFKRPALDDGDVPSAKKTRSAVTNNTSLRATPVKPVDTQYVLFTAFPYEAVKVKLEKLGAVVTTDLMNSTVVLTRQIKRTFKLLCAVGLGKPIVGPSWVQACADNNTIVDPWLYLMKDEAAEKRFHFSLERTLTGKRNFLERYTISATPSVMPEPHEMKVIVECSGGVWKEGGPQWICVTVPDDQPLWPDLRHRGAILVSTEFILGGVLRQRVDINANKYKI